MALSERISIVALELVALSQVGPIQMGKGPHGGHAPQCGTCRRPCALSGLDLPYDLARARCDLARADAQLVL